MADVDRLVKFFVADGEPPMLWLSHASFGAEKTPPPTLSGGYTLEGPAPPVARGICGRGAKTSEPENSATRAARALREATLRRQSRRLVAGRAAGGDIDAGALSRVTACDVPPAAQS